VITRSNSTSSTIAHAADRISYATSNQPSYALFTADSTIARER